jgi:hypothetical protein
LKLSDLAPLAEHLRTPSLDLTPNVIDVRQGFALKGQFGHSNNKFASRYLAG